MRENDIIENIRDLYDVKAPNVRGKLDFAAVEIVPPPAKKLNRRYIYAGIAYAAACLVVIGLIPFLIGKDRPEPTQPPKDSVGLIAGDSSGSAEESVTTAEPHEPEKTAPESAEPEETEEIVITEPAESGDTAPADPESVPDTNAPETPKPLAKKYSVYDAKRITAKDSGINAVIGFNYSEYLDGPVPMYKITFWESRLTSDNRVYGTRYDYTFDANAGKITGKTVTGDDHSYKGDVYETYCPKNSIPYGYSFFSGYKMFRVCEVVNGPLMKMESRAAIQMLTDVVKRNAGYSDNNYNEVFRFVDCLSRYDDAFFEENVIYIYFNALPSGSMSSGIEKIAVEGTTLKFSFNEYRPNDMTDDMAGDVFVFTFDRDDLKGVKNAKATLTSIQLDDPEDNTPEPPRSKTYADPAKSTRIRFFKDIERTEEYKSTADIPYGAKVYYLMENDPGYIITNFKINVYWQGFDVDFIPNDGCGIPVDYFINNYLGDKLEYSYTAVLAGDADGNLYYDENDVNILRKYLDNDAEMLYKYGQYGYNEKLDYDCNGVVTEKDLEGLLAEIENGTAERNTMSEHNYSSGVGTKTTLLKFDKATIMPHGLHPYQVEYDYSVHKTYAEAAILSKEIHDKYDPDFYVMEDLILIYCYTENGEMPELSELSALWHTHNNHTEYLIPVYSDDNKGQILSEYAIVLEKQNNKYLSTPAPT